MCLLTGRLLIRILDNRLWFTPQGYDLIIWCRGLHWKVHRSVLVDMSEWMEKYMPPPAKNVSRVLQFLGPSIRLQHSHSRKND